MRILGAIVTYNRCELLSRCLDQLLIQTLPVDEVLVINNGSTDSTVSMLRSRGIPFVTQKNVGSAGGWHRAIEHAQRNYFDAIWLMDDDGFPEAVALEALVRSLVEGVACASSIVVREDDPTKFVFPFPRLDSKGHPLICAWPRKMALVSELRAIAPSGNYPFAHFFNGSLISVKAISLAGNIDKGFFMYGEEVDYFHRLRAVGKVFSVISAKHFHPDVRQRPYTAEKVYYYVKNSIILNSRYLNYPRFRHGMVILAALGRVLHRNGLCMFFSFLVGSRRQSFYAAIARGFKGRVAGDFSA